MENGSFTKKCTRNNKKMTTEQIKTAYEVIRRYTKDEDIIQDVLLKLLQNPWDESKTAFKTWVTTIYMTTNISYLRKVKEFNLIEFETASDDGVEVITAADFLESDESSWLEDEIAREEKEELLNRLKMLSEKEQEILNNYLIGKISNKNSTERVILKRAMEKIITKTYPSRYKFVVRNIETGEETKFETQKEASKKMGISHKTINSAYVDNKIFKKKYKIEKNILK